VIVHTRLEGESLAGNLLGDPTERDLFVYLPPGYHDSARRYPVAVLLHAAGSSAARLANPPADSPRWSPPIEDVLEPVFARQGVAPMIVVVPDGDTRVGCSQWVDSPVTGNFARYVVHDVLEHVDKNYRTLAQPASRGILGFSSGGFGAWNIASQHPETFGALAMLSGDSYLELTHKHMLYRFLDSIWPEAPSGPLEGNEWAQLVYDYAATYSPNVSNPPFFVDLPISFPSGEIIEEVWARWLSFDPVVNWRERQANLRALRGILLDVGTADDYQLQWGHRLLSHHLRVAGIDHVATENAGNHGGRSRERYQVALAWLAGVLEVA
jgi:S-formylglutathione hydrolase FrmB